MSLSFNCKKEKESSIVIDIGCFLFPLTENDQKGIQITDTNHITQK